VLGIAIAWAWTPMRTASVRRADGSYEHTFEIEG
jgi:hypothetical protein